MLMRSISFNGDNVKQTLRSVSFNGRESEPTILKTFGSGKLIIQGSLSFKKEDTGPLQLETKILIQSPPSEKDSLLKPSFIASRFSPSRKRALESPIVKQHCPKHRAAVKLQKVYKSFRTRRQLADCAVLLEQRWWKLLDFALLKRNSVSFFHVDEPESVYSRWSRAGRRAATVGRGLSKDDKAQKLALQHWLEAIDPRHRYGHNLHFYYDHWLRCDSKEPFFYWLDVGEGKEVNLENKCSRSKLQQQCIKYLGPKERERYEVIVEDGKLMYKQSMELVDTSKGHKDSKWIFVLSTLKSLYVGQKKKGKFQHSSFLAGGATSAAGRLVVDNGTLKVVWPHSGHYRPTKENFEEFISFLKENDVDLTDVQLSPSEEDEKIHGLKSVRSEQNLSQGNISAEPEGEVETSSVSGRTRDNDSFEPSEGVNYGSPSVEMKSESNRTVNYQKLHKKITMDQEESDDETDERIDFSSMSKRTDSSEVANVPSDFESAGHDMVEASSTSETDYMLCKKNMFIEEREDDEEVAVPQELILHRINSKKEVKSYQLGKQLSCKWTSGAGPRIGCVRDYPSELQFRALEQVSLSPRSERLYSSPKFFSSPHNPSIQSPRIQEVPLSQKVPFLQKPNIHK